MNTDALLPTTSILMLPQHALKMFAFMQWLSSRGIPVLYCYSELLLPRPADWRDKNAVVIGPLLTPEARTAASGSSHGQPCFNLRAPFPLCPTRLRMMGKQERGTIAQLESPMLPSTSSVSALQSESQRRAL